MIGTIGVLVVERNSEGWGSCRGGIPGKDYAVCRAMLLYLTGSASAALLENAR
jgi:hypothetical protein